MKNNRMGANKTETVQTWNWVQLMYAAVIFLKKFFELNGKTRKKHVLETFPRPRNWNETIIYYKLDI